MPYLEVWHTCLERLSLSQDKPYYRLHAASPAKENKKKKSRGGDSPEKYLYAKLGRSFSQTCEVLKTSQVYGEVASLRRACWPLKGVPYLGGMAYLSLIRVHSRPHSRKFASENSRLQNVFYLIKLEIAPTLSFSCFFSTAYPEIGFAIKPPRTLE